MQSGRRIVTILFADLEGSTDIGDRLDPEALSRVMDRYFETLSGVLTRHGGTVEKYIGDAVVAVFGVPRLHEDDALRAVRSASDIVDEVRSLNDEIGAGLGIRLDVRVGVNTGEVVTNPSSAPGQRLMTGDAANVASRLQETAGAGEVVLSHTTYELVRDRVRVGPPAEVALRGKRAAITAYRLERLVPEAPFVRSSAVLVGRDREMDRLESGFEACVAGSRLELFTVIGAAGVGKSRLVWELERRLRGRARLVRGRCLSYGHGITFGPIAEIVYQVVEIASSDSQAVARQRLADFLAATADGRAVADRLAQVVGLESGSAPREELFWSVRRFLETLARRQPLVVVIDDIHWAEPTLLDLLDDIVDWTADLPILLLCVSRPDLLDQRPGWGGGKRNATSLILAPLEAARANELLSELAGSDLPADVLTRLAQAGEGNPLFIEESFRMLIDRGTLRREAGRWEVDPSLSTGEIPPNIQALLAARLDQLGPAERQVALAAAVVGRSFSRAALEPLVSKDAIAELKQCLRTLIRKDVIRAGEGSGPVPEQFRFRHDLIRDAAYGSLPKSERADLHVRHAEWLEQAVTDRIAEYDALIGSHLDQAYLYRMELGLSDDETQDVGRRAGRWMARAGQAANQRRDVAAASTLLSRAMDLLDRDDPLWVPTLLEYGDLIGTMGDYAKARSLIDDAVRLAVDRDPVVARKARLYVLYWRSQSEGVSEDLVRVTREIVDEFIAAGDDKLTAEAMNFLAVAIHQNLGELLKARSLLEQAGSYAERSGDQDRVAGVLANLVGLGVRDETPCAQVLEDCRRVLELPGLAMSRRAACLEHLAVLSAMRVDFDAAREALREARSIDRALGIDADFERGIGAGLVEQMAGDPAAAEAAYRRAHEIALAYGDSLAPFMAARQARTLVDLGRDDEAVGLTEEAEQDDSLWTRILWQGARARIFARQGRREDAVRLAEWMLHDAREGGFEGLPNIFAGALEDAADVMQRIGRRDEAVRHLEDAIARYEAKGNIAAARLAQLSLEEVAATPT